MNKVFLLQLILILTAALHTNALAKEKELTPAQLNTLFSEKTFSVEDLSSKKSEKFKAYATDMGGLRVIHPDGASNTRAWSVRENGTFCYSAPATNRKGGGTCGFIVPEGKGVYKMYKQKGKNRKGKPILIFSDFKQGNQL